MYSSDDGNAFGFQSLSSLFGQSKSGGRYSRPRAREAEAEPVRREDKPVREQSSHGDVNENSRKPFFASFLPAEQSESPKERSNLRSVGANDASGGTRPVAKQSVPTWSSEKQNERNSDEVAKPTPALPAIHNESQSQLPRIRVSRREFDEPVISKVMSESNNSDAQAHDASMRRRIRQAPVQRQALYRKDYPRPLRSWAQTSETGAQVERRPDPFMLASSQESTVLPNRTSDAGHAWGLSQEDQTTIDTLTDPNAPSTIAVPVPPSPKVRGTRQTKATPQPSAGASPSKLTHLTPSGEAHMVDVSAKAPTRRTAIATTSIALTDPATFPLITSNNSKKGDVLGVARIAGIMAAKRTSSLIPLCHPIAITKVDLDITAVEPKVVNAKTPRNSHGVILCQARVDCVGPTGVEMEALTAVSVAALTVYDMLKAVDKSMNVRVTRLVYKSGGKSGMFVYRHWYENGGEQYLREQGLELPKDLD